MSVSPFDASSEFRLRARIREMRLAAKSLHGQGQELAAQQVAFYADMIEQDVYFIVEPSDPDYLRP